MTEKTTFSFGVISIFIGIILFFVISRACSFGGCNQGMLPLPFLHFFIGTIILIFSKIKSSKDKSFVLNESTRKMLQLLVVIFGIVAYLYAFLVIDIR